MMTWYVIRWVVLVFRCRQTQIPLWVGICRGQRAIRRWRGCGSSSKTRSCTRMLQVRWGLVNKTQSQVIIRPKGFNVHLTCCVSTQDVAALESQPLLGFVLKVDPLQKLQFKLYHKNTLYYVFKADDVQTAQRYRMKSQVTYWCVAWQNKNIDHNLLISLNRWIDSFKEATVL